MTPKITVGIDISPLHNANKVRGVGFYTERLLTEIKKLRNLEIKELKTEGEIKKWNFDVLHIPYFSPSSFTVPLVKKKPVVVTIHDLIPVKYPVHYPLGIKGGIRWEIQKFLLRRNVDFVITDSLASKYDIADLTGYPQDRIYPIYLAAGKEFKKLKVKSEKLKIKKKYNLPEKFVLYVGDVNWNKNIPGLVKACEKIKMPLVIAGKQAIDDDYDRSHVENQDLVWLQQRAKSASQRNKFLILLGFVPTTDLVTIYNLATVYCQPSFDEGFGLPVLEAMVCNCPVVCTNRGSLPEVVGKAAKLVESTVDGIAKGLEETVFDLSINRKLVNAGLKRLKEFSWRKTAEKTLFVYKLASGKM